MVNVRAGLQDKSISLPSIAGKSTTCELLSDALGFRYINVGKCVASQSLHSGWDPKFEAHIIDEDKVTFCQNDARQICKLHQHGDNMVTGQRMDMSILLSPDRSVMLWRISLQRAEQLLIITAVTSSLKGDLHNAMLQIVFYFVLADFLVLLQ